MARAVLGELQRQGASIAPSVQIDPILARPHPRWNNPAIAAEMAAALRDAITPLAAAAVARQWSAGLSELASSEPSAADLRACAARWPTLRRLLEPAEVVVAGPPNAGKSSLVNALAGRDVSIVSDIPGTTRDWVRTLIDLDGVPIWLTDTAGLWEETFSSPGACPGANPGANPGAMLPRSLGKHDVPPHEVDREALERAWQRIAAADLVICLTAGEPSPTDRPLLAQVLSGPGADPGAMLPRCLAKHDVPPQGEGADAPDSSPYPGTSCFPGPGAMLPRCLGKHDVPGQGEDTSPLDPPPYPRTSCFPRKQGSMAPGQGDPAAGQNVLYVSSKADCIPPAEGAQLAVSAKTFAGMPELRQAVIERLGLADFDPNQPAAFTARQAALLAAAADAMEARDLPAAQAALRELLGNSK